MATLVHFSYLKSGFLRFFALLLLVFSLQSCPRCDRFEEEVQIRIESLTEDENFSEADRQEVVDYILGWRTKAERCGWVVKGEVDKKLLDQAVSDLCPPCEIDPPPANSKYNYSIFIENTRSMDGYMSQASQFKRTVTSFVTDLEVKDLADTCKVFFANEELTKFDEQFDELLDYLTPQTFRRKGKYKRPLNANTDIAGLLKNTLFELPSNEVGILIADFIFSPGSDKDPREYLPNQEAAIKTHFSRLLEKNPETSILLIKLESEFKGEYFDQNHEKKIIESSRPYYIMLVGPKAGIDLFWAREKIGSLPGYVNHYFLGLTNGGGLDYKASQYNVIGSFTNCRSGRGNGQCISNIKLGTRGEQEGKFQFSLAVDLRDFHFPSNYLKDRSNFTVDHGFEFTDVLPLDDELIARRPDLEGYSHFLLVATDSRPQAGSLKVKIKDNIPHWVSESSSDNDVDQSGDELKKTYGLEYLVNGIHQAVQARSAGYQRDYLAEMTIELQ